jgi:hypothetical protein
MYQFFIHTSGLRGKYTTTQKAPKHKSYDRFHSLFSAFYRLYSAIRQNLFTRLLNSLYNCCNICEFTFVKLPKPADMKKTIIIIIALSAVFIITSFLAVRTTENTVEMPDCDKVNTECCLEKKPDSHPANKIWQNFSREFISLLPRLN